MIGEDLNLSPDKGPCVRTIRKEEREREREREREKPTLVQSCLTQHLCCTVHLERTEALRELLTHIMTCIFASFFTFLKTGSQIQSRKRAKNCSRGEPNGPCKNFDKKNTLDGDNCFKSCF